MRPPPCAVRPQGNQYSTRPSPSRGGAIAPSPGGRRRRDVTPRRLPDQVTPSYPAGGCAGPRPCAHPIADAPHCPRPGRSERRRWGRWWPPGSTNGWTSTTIGRHQGPRPALAPQTLYPPPPRAGHERPVPGPRSSRRTAASPRCVVWPLANPLHSRRVVAAWPRLVLTQGLGRWAIVRGQGVTPSTGVRVLGDIVLMRGLVPNREPSLAGVLVRAVVLTTAGAPPDAGGPVVQDAPGMPLRHLRWVAIRHLAVLTVWAYRAMGIRSIAGDSTEP